MSKPSGFIWYELMSSDLEGAMAFYSKVVGWDVHDSGMPGMRYMLFGRDGKDVGGMMEWSSLGMTAPTVWKAHIYTDNVDARAAAVVADGGTEHRGPQDIPGVGRFANMADPQGAEFLLFQPSPTEERPTLRPTEVGAVGWNELTTTNWEAAWDFYSKHFGWTKGAAVDMGPMGTYQTFMTSEDGAGGGMMTIPEAFKESFKGPLWLFYFTVDDIHAAAARVKDNGGMVTHEPSPVPGEAWILQATDPQGGRFALTAAK